VLVVDVDIVLGGSASLYLAEKISRLLGAEFSPLVVRNFPDGETYVRIPVDVDGKRVALVQSMYRRPNEYLMEFVLAAKSLKELGATRVIGIIPYFPYTRQDSRFKPGEAVSARIVAELVEWAGVDSLITVDMHLHRFKSPSELFKVKVVNLSASGLLAKAAVEKFNLNNVVVVGPDEEAEQWASVAAKEIGAKHAVLTKERVGDEEVRVTGGVNVGGRDALLVDDIVSTGGTLAEAAKHLLSMGARSVYAVCTHGILVSGAERKLYEAGISGFLFSDSVPSPYSEVSVAPIIAEALRGGEE